MILFSFLLALTVEMQLIQQLVDYTITNDKQKQ